MAPLEKDAPPFEGHDGASGDDAGPFARRGSKTGAPQEAPSIVIRRLWPAETPLLTSHLCRLHGNDRRWRFGRSVSDDFIADYVGRLRLVTNPVFGLFAGETLRGAGLLEAIDWRWPLSASAWLSVEGRYQGRGQGHALLSRLLNAARNRMISQLYVLCPADNHAMRRLAEHFGGTTDVFRDETESRFTLGPPNPATVALEAMAEMQAMTHLWASHGPYWSLVPIADRSKTKAHGSQTGSAL